MASPPANSSNFHNIHIAEDVPIARKSYRKFRNEKKATICFFEQARKCRALPKTAMEPQVIEELRLWAVELAEEAEQAEWRRRAG